MTRYHPDAVVDYAKLYYYERQHHARYARYVEAHGLICQACGGWGRDKYSYGSYQPPEPCGWCETTGKVTRWLRGQWLRACQWEKRQKVARMARLQALRERRA